MKANILKSSVLIVFLLSVVSCGEKDGAVSDAATAACEAGVPVSDLKIATVNIDSINSGFQMVADIQNELAQTEERLTRDIQNQANSFQKEYENYLKIGATLTLSEQHKREEYLTQKQQSITELQQTYANQIVSLQAQRMEEVTSTILEFINRFNQENGQYSMVISTGKSSGVLYSLPSMDITSAVLAGLNKEYADKKAEESK